MEQQTETHSSTWRVRNGAVGSGQPEVHSVVTDHARRGRGSAIGASAHPPSCRESASCDQCLDGSPPATQNMTRVHFLSPMLPHKT